MEAYDPNLTLTYVGGCPSRCCYPVGYGRAKERKVTTHRIGMTYDGVLLTTIDNNKLQPHVVNLLLEIIRRERQ